MKELGVEKIDQVKGGLFGTCFDEAAYASITWIKWTKNSSDTTLLAAFILAEAKLFACAMA